MNRRLETRSETERMIVPISRRRPFPAFVMVESQWVCCSAVNTGNNCHLWTGDIGMKCELQCWSDQRSEMLSICHVQSSRSSQKTSRSQHSLTEDGGIISTKPGTDSECLQRLA